MSANSIIRKSIKAPRSLFLLQTRNQGTRSVSLAAPTMMASHIEFATSSFNQSPASGWNKTIVSSSSSMPIKEDTSASSFEEIDAERKKLEQHAEADGLTLEVDMEELQYLASLRCTPLKLADMYKYAVDFNNKAQRLLNAQFLHREIPIRLAQRAVDLLTLPHGLSDSLPIRRTAHVYLLYLEKFQEFPVPTTSEEEQEFTEMLERIVLDRQSIPIAIAAGVDEWRQKLIKDETELSRLQEMEDALYRFFTARVGLRFLAEHHILSSPNRKPGCQELRKSVSCLDDDDDFLGCIQTDCDPTKEVQKVADSITKKTKNYYGICPEIQIVDSASKSDSKFTYVPHHLHYMVSEILKNSCRATVRKHLELKASGIEKEMPPIRVVIVKGDEDVTIKIADRGGGIPRSKHASIFAFAHSTAGQEESKSEFGVDEVTGTKIRGFGLPLARIYARYLGGELTLKSMEGYGLDAYLHLPRLGEACENLPLPVRFSPGELNSNPPRRAVVRRPFSTYMKREFVEADESAHSNDANRIAQFLNTKAL